MVQQGTPSLRLSSVDRAQSLAMNRISPIVTDGSGRALNLDSRLQDLPMHRCGVEIETSGSAIAQVFEQHPMLPGVILQESDTYVGILSRHQLLECLLRPHGQELLQEPVRVLYSYIRRRELRLAGETSILSAAQQALRRSPESIGEPLVVCLGDGDSAVLDIHVLNIAYWQIRGVETQVRYERTQAQMLQSEKMASLGRLVDGVAHEILDPVSFIWGNLQHITDYSRSLLEVLAAYETLVPTPPIAIQQIRHELEVDYLQDDLPKVVDSIKTGAERLSKLASSLQNFCHIDEVYPKPADLHELIESTLLLLKTRLSSEIKVIRSYGSLPPIACFSGQLHQVMMNILVRAVDGLLNEAVSQQVDLATNPDGQPPNIRFKPTILITTQMQSIVTDVGESRWVSIGVADNGPSLSDDQRQAILESFSVAYRAEKETSLSMSYRIITAKHGGKFEMRSPSLFFPNRGTEFEILLPLT